MHVDAKEATRKTLPDAVTETRCLGRDTCAARATKLVRQKKTWLATCRSQMEGTKERKNTETQWIEGKGRKEHWESDGGDEVVSGRSCHSRGQETPLRHYCVVAVSLFEACGAFAHRRSFSRLGSCL